MGKALEHQWFEDEFCIWEWNRSPWKFTIPKGESVSNYHISGVIYVKLLKCTSISEQVQGGPLPVLSEVITLINGHVYNWDISPYKGNNSICYMAVAHLVVHQNMSIWIQYVLPRWTKTCVKSTDFSWGSFNIYLLSAARVEAHLENGTRTGQVIHLLHNILTKHHHVLGVFGAVPTGFQRVKTAGFFGRVNLQEIEGSSSWTKILNTSKATA